MAGGTGGHIYPALAVAEAFRERGIPLHWLGSRRGMENRIVPAAGIPLSVLTVSGLRGSGLLRALSAPFMLLIALVQALVTMLKLRPALVLGMGGFASGPGGIAAWLCRRPLVIHEQNAVAGATNRILARFATCKLEAFPGSLPGAKLVGNPVRGDIAALGREAGSGETAAGPRILVVGGSRGARALNEHVPGVLTELAGRYPLSVVHQCGSEEQAATTQRYAALGAAAEVRPFIDDMCAAYRSADLCICRAGAMTVAELAAAGRPAVLVPYPHAVDDHQSANARYLSDSGAAVLLPQQELERGALRGILEPLLAAPARLKEMGRQALALGRPGATGDVAAVCMGLIHGR